jgi:hypothetical protein
LSEPFQPPDEPPYQQPYGSPPPFTPPKEGSAWKGFGFSVLLHILQIPICLLLSLYDRDTPMFSLLFIGVSQLIYMIPAIIIAGVKGKSHIMKGLIIGASVVFLLNAACTGLFFALMINSYSH